MGVERKTVKVTILIRRIPLPPPKKRAKLNRSPIPLMS
jgi:hypothetical protein